MKTPTTAIVLRYPRSAPILMPITIDCEPLMPVLRFPPSVDTTLQIYSTSQLPSPTNPLRLQVLNPVSMFAMSNHHIQMTVTLQSRESVIEPCPTRHQMEPDYATLPNFTQYPVSSF